MRELDALLSSMNQTLSESKLVIQSYDTVKDSFSMVKTRASNMATQGVVFDFSKFEKKYSKALSANDFDKANLAIQEADGAMDMAGMKYSEASGIREEMDAEYDKIVELKIPGKKFIDVIRSTDKFFEEGKYDDVVRMSKGNIQDMKEVIEWQQSAQQSLEIARDALEKGKKSGSKMEISSNLLEQAESAFKNGDYQNADDLARDSAEQALTSNEAYTKALSSVTEAREELSSFGNLADVTSLKEIVDGMQDLLANEEFEKVNKEAKKLSSKANELRESSKPKVDFDFDRDNFVKDQVKKLVISFENTGTASANNFDFELLDEDMVQLQRIKKNIKQLDSGEKEEMEIFIKFTESGIIPFTYRVKFQNALTGSHHKLNKDEEIMVHASSEQASVSIAQTQIQTRPAIEYTEWTPQATVTGSDAESLLDYLSSHRESYLRYPNNEKILNHLRKVKYKFPLYFEIPEEPKDILNEWGLPENLRGNVILNDDRSDALEAIMESSPEQNYVIMGDPGIGKTVLLFEAFDKFMGKQPTGYLSNDNFRELLHQNLGLRMFYDDLPENKQICDAIESSEVRGLVVSSREVDWNDLPSGIRDKFIPLIITKFDNQQMYDVCKSMLTFSGLNFSEGALELLVEYADGSPIYVYSMIKELKSKQITRLQDEYIKNNAEKGMHNYISSLLQRLLKEKGDYLAGGLHSLVCLIFLSRELNERRCSPIFFIKFGENISEYTVDKLDDSIEKKLFTKVQQYMSGKGNIVRFPHDTWADVIDGKGMYNAFKADIDRILLEFQQTRTFDAVKDKAAEESWITVSEMLKHNRNANIDRYLSVAETLLHNYDIDQLSKYKWMDIDDLRKTTAQFLNKPLAKNLNNILEKSQSRQMNIMIKDSVVNRSNIGGDGAGSGNVDISDSIVNRSK